MMMSILGRITAVCLGFLSFAASAQPFTAATQERTTFSHPQGFSFQHPADWRVEYNTEYSQLLPPGLTAADQAENYRLLTDASPVDAGDPRFAAELNRLAAQLPGFNQLGAVQGYKTKSGTGVRGVWEGTNATTHQPIQLRMYAATVKGLAIVLFAAGQAAKLDAREVLLREIATSVTSAAVTNQQAPPGRAEMAGNNDSPPMAQKWLQRLRGKKLTLLSSYSSGSSGGMSSKTEIHLNADGHFRAYSESAVSVSVPGVDGSSGGTRQASGSWRIYLHDGRPVLETRYENGEIETGILEDRDGQTFINGKRWFVTAA